ncbi:UxaA family hydrolase [Escherichia coli]
MPMFCVALTAMSGCVMSCGCLPTVGCVNGIARQIRDRFLKETDNAKVRAGVLPLRPHLRLLTTGRQSHQHPHHAAKRRAPPNAGAVLVIGLGLSNNEVAAFRETLGDMNPERVHFINLPTSRMMMEAE